MDELQIHIGDTLLLKGKRRRESVCIVLPDDTMDDDKIRMNGVVRNNLCVKIGYVLSFNKIDVQSGKRIHVQPIDDKLEGSPGDWFEVYLKPYFQDAYRPIHQGDTFVVNVGVVKTKFKVIETDPAPCCFVVSGTVIQCEDRPIRKQYEEDHQNNIGYEDIGGYRDQVAQVRKIVKLSLWHPELSNAVGSKPPRAILLHGPHGTGKTLIARAIATETEFFHIINGQNICYENDAEAERIMREAFENAELNAPALIVIEELDKIVDKNISLLLKLMESFRQTSRGIILATANDQDLKNIGGFDHDVNIGLPNTNDRLEILKIHTRNMKLADDLSLRQIAVETEGHDGAGLAALCRAAALKQVLDNVDQTDLEEDERVDDEVIDSLSVTKANFRHAMNSIRSGGMDFTQPSTSKHAQHKF